MKKRLPIVLLLISLLAGPVMAAEPPAGASAAQKVVCPSPEEHSRERPPPGCEVAIVDAALADDPAAYQRHLRQEVQKLELQVLGYGLLIGFAGRLAGRSFWRWFGLGAVLRLALAALVLLPL